MQLLAATVAENLSETPLPFNSTFIWFPLRVEQCVLTFWQETRIHLYECFVPSVAKSFRRRMKKRPRCSPSGALQYWAFQHPCLPSAMRLPVLFRRRKNVLSLVRCSYWAFEPPCLPSARGLPVLLFMRPRTFSLLPWDGRLFFCTLRNIFWDLIKSNQIWFVVTLYD